VAFSEEDLHVHVQQSSKSHPSRHAMRLGIGLLRVGPTCPRLPDGNYATEFGNEHELLINQAQPLSRKPEYDAFAPSSPATLTQYFKLHVRTMSIRKPNSRLLPAVCDVCVTDVCNAAWTSGVLPGRRGSGKSLIVLSAACWRAVFRCFT
jgi:hypothetical protein